MRQGSGFEQFFKRKASKKMLVYRFRDAAILANTRGMYRIPVPADFMAVKEGKVVFVECKSAERLLKSHIRDHQLKYAKALPEHGVPYVFLIEDTVSGMIYAVHGTRFLELYEGIPGKASTIKFEKIEAIAFYISDRKNFDPVKMFDGAWKEQEILAHQQQGQTLYITRTLCSHNTRKQSAG